ncbi:hypothetical protein N7490_008095 [Penicillium lividum]|nr:hypothetical protein N7490_008095 [Penicillium lividum]
MTVGNKRGDGGDTCVAYRRLSKTCIYTEEKRKPKRIRNFVRNLTSARYRTGRSLTALSNPPGLANGAIRPPLTALSNWSLYMIG